MLKPCLQLCLCLLFTLPSAALFAADIEKLAADEWLLVSSNNFEVVTDLDEAKAKTLVEDLEAYRYFSIQLMKLDVLTNLKPLKILAISSNANFKALDLPENWAGVFGLNSFGYSAIANVNDYRVGLKTNTFARQTLLHEYNHFLVRMTGSTQYLPTWYDEGMAEYWGSFRYDGEKVYIGDPSAIEGRIYDLVNGAGAIQLDSQKLFNAPPLPLNSNKQSDKDEVGRFYAQAFFMIHYLNSSPQLRAQLQQYIDYLSSGYREAQAFAKAFNMSHEQLDKNAKKYLKKSLLMRVMSFSDKNIEFPKPALATSALTKASLYAHMSSILPNYGVMDKAATKQLLETTLQLNPSDTAAKIALLRRGLATDPQTLLKELEARDPQNAMLLSYKADGLRGGANFMRSAGMQGWEDQMKRARALYRRAINSDPALAQPYFGIGDAYNFLPTSEPLEEAIAGYDTAALYSRGEATLANLADIYIRMDKKLDALPALRNVVAATEDKERSSYALVLDNLEILKNASQDQGELSADGILYHSGARYQGALENGKPHGLGKLTRPSGSYYEGQFVNGAMHGQGTLATYGGFRYSGEFQQGIARGKGNISYPQGAWKKSYTGEVYYGIPFGKGSEVNKHGRYEGDYWYAFYQGQGTFTSAQTQTALSGTWIENRFAWPEENGIAFVGYVSESGQRHGLGICFTDKRSKMDWCSFDEGVYQVKPSAQK